MRKSLTKRIIGDIHTTMSKKSIERELRELVKSKGLRKVARDLDLDHSSLFRSLQDDSNIKLNRARMILDYFGYELKISRRKEVNPKFKPLRSRPREGGD